jgi:hypothetical protein
LLVLALDRADSFDFQRSFFVVGRQSYGTNQDATYKSYIYI